MAYDPAPFLVQALRRLSAQWRLEAAAKDAFHATMGMGWRACATDLDRVLMQAQADTRERDVTHGD